MARFDVHGREPGSGYLLDCQADVLRSLSTRLVVPLLPPHEGPPPIARLNPSFRIAGEEVVMYTQFAASVPVRELKEPVASLAEQDIVITNAFDLLISGF